MAKKRLLTENVRDTGFPNLWFTYNYLCICFLCCRTAFHCASRDFYYNDLRLKFNRMFKPV